MCNCYRAVVDKFISQAIASKFVFHWVPHYHSFVPDWAKFSKYECHSVVEQQLENLFKKHLKASVIFTGFPNMAQGHIWEASKYLI